MRTVAFFLACLVLAAQSAWAQPSGVRKAGFREEPYYEPLFAEPRAARILLLVPAWSKEFPQSVEPGARFSWQIVLGKELPILAVSSQQADGRLTAGKWGFGFWVPISFHMIEDFKDESNPIVDTDYRFGFMVKGQYAWTDQVRLGFRFVPLAHESTHLGDEYTIHASAQPGFERVNVSNEYHEYGISNPEQQQWSWSMQLGRSAVPGTNTRGEPLKQYFVQLYRGVNPYGQLRSQSDYWSVGIGFVFGQ